MSITLQPQTIIIFLARLVLPPLHLFITTTRQIVTAVQTLSQTERLQPEDLDLNFIPLVFPLYQLAGSSTSD